MHRLRHLLRRLRRGGVEPGLPRACGAESRVDPGQGRTGWENHGKAARHRGRRGLPFLPYPHELHRALPEAALPDGRDRRVEARSCIRRAQRKAMTFRAQSLLWVAQRASAAVLALCVLVHLATMIYAVRGGLTAGEILQRTSGSASWAIFYGVFVL